METCTQVANHPLIHNMYSGLRAGFLSVLALSAALLFYKKACHLVPDIDFKLNKEQPPQSSDSEDSGDEGTGLV